MKAFSTFREMVVEALVLAYPNASKSHIVHTDASVNRKSGVISHCWGRGVGGQEQMVTCFIESFDSCQRNSCITR